MCTTWLCDPDQKTFLKDASVFQSGEEMLETKAVREVVTLFLRRALRERTLYLGEGASVVSRRDAVRRFVSKKFAHRPPSFLQPSRRIVLYVFFSFFSGCHEQVHRRRFCSLLFMCPVRTGSPFT